MIIIDGTSRPTDFTRTGGRLWIPSGHIDGEGDATFSDALVCCPLGKYIFVAPRGAYNAEEFIGLRDTTEALSTNAQVTSYVFWLGDSSSCGGTVIAHDTSDPAQAFLRDPAVQAAFHIESITRGGFFLLGDRQGAGAAAAEIKKIAYDGQLDFLVLGVHQLPGEDPELPIVGLRHLIASIRWDFGFRKPILLMMSDDNPNVHLIKESDRDSFNSNEWNASVPAAENFAGTPLLLGDITHQAELAASGTDSAQQAAEIAVLDRTGYLGLNWWPVMAFVPNSAGGRDIEETIRGMGGTEQPGKAFYHPLLIPTAGVGCPFFTNRAMTANELALAELSFEFPFIAGGTNRTTSVWFWDFDRVRNNSRVRSWTFPRGRLDATEANLEYVSDTSVAWESTPTWVSHPILGKEFAMEIYLAARSVNTSARWFGNLFPDDKFGNTARLLGAGDVEDGWITSIVPFLLSPTAAQFGQYQGFAPLIPPWVKFSWVLPDDMSIEEAGSLAEFIDDAETYMSTRVAGGQPRNVDVGDCAGGEETGKRWSFGVNQPRVVLSGTVCGGVFEESDTFLDLRIAPFAIHPQVRNLNMGQTMPNGRKTSIVWPSRLFYIAPIILPVSFDMFAPNFAYNVPLGFWSNQGFNFSGAGGTPLIFDLMQRENLQMMTGAIPTSVDVVMEAPTEKGDFPPMMDTFETEGGAGRRLANHLARVDIAPGRVSRVAEGVRSGGGGIFPKACAGANSKLSWGWPIRDNKKIVITSGFTDIRDYGPHCAIDLIYEDGSERGTNILAAADGTIITNAWCSQCGHYIEIEHLVPPFPSTTRVISRYLHMDTPSTRLVGDEVRRGDSIGRLGSLGAGSTGAHLHFALYCNTVGDCEATGIDPCAVLPTPANGVCHYSSSTCTDGCGETDIESLIRSMFTEAITDAGESPTLITPDGPKLKVDIAVAVAYAESGLRREAQNCITIAGVKYSHVGLFQIQNPTHINNDVDAGNISLSSVITNDPNCPGIRIAQDYKRVRNNILAAIRISQNGSNWNPWETYTGGAYLRFL